MDSFYTIFLIILIVFGILQIVLFFKIWGMTNNVSDIRTLLFNKINDIDTNGKQNNPSIIKAKTSPLSGTWGKDVTDEEKDKARSIIPKLVDNEVIIKLSKNDTMIVYSLDTIHELVNEAYKIVYYK